MAAVYAVRIFPLSQSRYVAGVYAGLYNLAALGEAQISVTFRPAVRIRERNGSYNFQNNQHIAWLEVTDVRGGQQRRLCFDMMDNKYLSTEGGLLHCDVYFKRSYDSAWVATLDPRLRRKVLPYGLYYPVSSPHERESIRRSLIYTFYTGQVGSDPMGFLKQLALPFWNALRGRTSESRGKIPCLQDLMADHESAVDAKIYFPTRVWDPAAAVDPDEKHAINEARVAVIRALKKEFGERFVGGLRESEFVRRTYPDCISHCSTKKADYLNLLRQNLVAVTTTGLVSSTGAKFPEYLAASRCIVSEPLRYETPYAIIPGTHYLPFATPAECVAACDRLLRDSRFASEMRHANHQLFMREVEPTATMRNVLRRAFELESACQ